MLIREKQEERSLDPRVRRTRQLLQQALMDLMREKSFQAITVQDIASRATVNRVTFYAHFEDKHALLEYTMREMFRQRLRSQLPEDAPFSPENLARLIGLVCEALAEVGRHCPPPYGQLEPLMEKQIKAELYQVVHSWLAGMPRGPTVTPFADAREQVVGHPLHSVARAGARAGAMETRPRGNSKSHPTPEQAAMVASWAIYGAAIQWSQKEKREPAKEFAQQVLPLILAGLQLSAKLPAQ
jgi:AcrR family transcriptional regulator